MENRYYQDILKAITEEKKLLAILIDPDKFDTSFTQSFLNKIPKETTHLFVGGSTVEFGFIEKTVRSIKEFSELPVFLFPGDYAQVTSEAEAILFLSLISGRNAEYLIGQQTKAVVILKDIDLEIISTGYILIDGGNESAVERVSETKAMPQSNVEDIVHTALAGEYLGAKFIYLEAGSGAKIPVNNNIIEAVKNAISIPLIVGGGIKTEEQKQKAYSYGADLVVMGTAFEN